LCPKEAAASSADANDAERATLAESSQARPHDTEGRTDDGRDNAESRGPTTSNGNRRRSRREKDGWASELSSSLKDSLNSLKESCRSMGVEWTSSVLNGESDGNDSAREEERNDDVILVIMRR